MDNLWKKDTEKAEYVDLFASERTSKRIDIAEMPPTRKNTQSSTEWRKKGNKFFGLQNYIEAMKCYNQSLCYAEIGSENMALAYSNRSACYFHMNKYEEVLVDIELARKANLPDRLTQKLKNREVESLLCISIKKSMSTNQQKAISGFKLSYEANKNFPCTVNMVKINQDAEFGRHLVAKRHIPVAKFILMERYFARATDQPLTYCTCSQEHKNCIPCPYCPDMMFCSVKCMKDDKFHELVCGTFYSQLDVYMRFEVKTLLLAINSFPDADNLIQFVETILLEDLEKLPTLNDQKSNYHFYFKLSRSSLETYPLGTEMAYKAYEYAIRLPKVKTLFDNNKKKRFLMHLALHHVLISRNNAFGDDKTIYIGNVSSILNHSCAFNVKLINSNGFIIGVTGRPIKKGEQLFINYEQDLNILPAKIRKATLKNERGFDCKCEICEPKRQSNKVPIDRELIVSDPCYKYLINNKFNINEAAVVQKKCIEFLKKFGDSQWSTEIEFVLNLFAQSLANHGSL